MYTHSFEITDSINLNHQFMHLSNSQSTLERTFSIEASSSPRKSRSYSLDPSNECRPIHLTEQLKQTFEFKQKGFKGNVRGEVIQQSFLTLHDLLSQTPDSVALNIEISKQVSNFAVYAFF